jgi:hypothetical protein
MKTTGSSLQITEIALKWSSGRFKLADKREGKTVANKIKK